MGEEALLLALWAEVGRRVRRAALHGLCLVRSGRYQHRLRRVSAGGVAGTWVLTNIIQFQIQPILSLHFLRVHLRRRHRAVFFRVLDVCLLLIRILRSNTARFVRDRAELGE